MLTDNDLLAILADCKFGDWNFQLVSGTPQPYVRVVFIARDAETGSRMVQHGRKLMLSRHMVKSEVVQTALLAVLLAVEHEARERFTYKGRAVFGPHMDVDKLVALCGQPDALDEREPPR